MGFYDGVEWEKMAHTGNLPNDVEFPSQLPNDFNTPKRKYQKMQLSDDIYSSKLRKKDENPYTVAAMKAKRDQLTLEKKYIDKRLKEIEEQLTVIEAGIYAIEAPRDYHRED